MNAIDQRHASWLEASARDRVTGLLDEASFREFVGPEKREMSPHLSLFDLPGAFDDGVVIGEGTLDGRKVFVAAQEGRFMGGTFGEVSGAKIVGLLRVARLSAADGDDRPVLLLLDTGGVRLQEANAGELAVSETIRAIAEARHAGVAVIALVGGRAGAFGGGGIIAACCSRIVISQHGRTGVTGPEVIETNRGVEEFDARDRALVWRITGGRTRRLAGGADRYVKDQVSAFREAAIELAASAAAFDLATMRAEGERLRARLQADSSPELVSDLTEDEFIAVLAERDPRDDAR